MTDKHTKERASERFGLDLDSWDCKALATRIQGKQEGCVLLQKQPPKRERWAVWHAGEWMPVVYDTRAKLIVTFLPPWELRRFKKKLPW